MLTYSGAQLIPPTIQLRQGAQSRRSIAAVCWEVCWVWCSPYFCCRQLLHDCRRDQRWRRMPPRLSRARLFKPSRPASSICNWFAVVNLIVKQPARGSSICYASICARQSCAWFMPWTKQSVWKQSAQWRQDTVPLLLSIVVTSELLEPTGATRLELAY